MSGFSPEWADGSANFGRVMTLSTRAVLLMSLAALPLACSSSDPATTPGSAGSSAAGSAGSNQAGSPAAGANAAAGAGAGGAGGSATAGSANGGSSTAGAAGSSAGAAGSVGSAGSSSVSCTGLTGTTAVGDKSIRDNQTCLTWTKTRAAATMTNKAAAKYCAGLEQDGISDWRMPLPEELVTWPDLATDGNAYITGPVYIPSASTEMDGCTGNSHSCNIAKYNDTSVTCAWQGVGFTGWVECVSGTPSAGSTKAAYAAASCSPCNSSVATFKVTDCSAYAN